MRTSVIVFISLAFVALSFLNASDIIWVCSTEEQPWQRKEVSLIPESDNGLPVTFSLKPNHTYQTIDGFGGSFNELGWVALQEAKSGDLEEVLEALFGEKGCAFTLARIPIGASDFALDGYSLDDVEEDYDLKHFSIERDRLHLLPYIRAAMEIRPDLQCWASPWSPPAWMKVNNSFSRGSLRWEPRVLNTYANYFARWIMDFRSEGIHLYAVSPQNEPNILNVYPTCKWTGEQLLEFIAGYLAPTLRKEGVDIELWLGLNGDPFNDGENVNARLLTVMENPEAYDLIAGIGFQYDSLNQIPTAHELYPDKKLMQSESMCFNSDNSWEQSQELYRLMRRYLEGGANAYFAWNMVLDETGKSSWDWPQNSLISVDSKSGEVTYNGEFYVYKHFSHYVKPGAKRIMILGPWGDKIAFQNPDGSVVMIIANDSESIQEVSFGMGGGFKAQLSANSINTFVLSKD